MGDSFRLLISIRAASNINIDYTALKIEIIDSQPERRLAAAIDRQPDFQYAGSAIGERDKGFMV